MKDKKTIIPLAPIPCPLSLPLTCGTHVSDSSSTFPFRSFHRDARGGGLCCPSAAPQLRPPSREPPRAPGPPPGPCRRRRRAGRPARCVLRHRPHPPPHPYPGHRHAGHRAGRRAPRPSLWAAPSAAACPSLRRAGRRASRGPPLRGPCPPPQHAPAAVVLAAITRAVPSAAQAGSSAQRGVHPAAAAHAAPPPACERCLLPDGSRQRAREGMGRHSQWWPARRSHGRGAAEGGRRRCSTARTAGDGGVVRQLAEGALGPWVGGTTGPRQGHKIGRDSVDRRLLCGLGRPAKSRCSAGT